ncbi:uncharacterized protein LOC106660310 [Trichogramma pretiosum]|uniref:uncharacterized protein LOC106660310 n=1 Tax=Trichogramma pretiosum TaxID=7493 RepID=UPI0006C94EF4|nr:uncharacterized protein LOC106660310 [Trichogramma pretiosum]
MDLLYDAADDYDDPFDFPFKIDDFQPLYVTSAKSISVEEDQGDDQSLSSVSDSKKLEKSTDETGLERKASIVYADRKSFIYEYEEEEYSSGEADSEVQDEIEEEKKVEEAEAGGAEEAEEAEEIFLKGDGRGFALGYGYDASTLRLSEEERRDIVSQLKSLAEDAQVGLAQNKFLHKQYIGTIRNAQVLAEALDRFDEVIVYESSRYNAMLENYMNYRDESEALKASHADDLQRLKDKCASENERHARMLDALIGQQLEVARKMKPQGARNKADWLEIVSKSIESQRPKIARVAQIRLACFKIQTLLEGMQDQLKELDRLGAGYSVIDYEYLLKRKEVCVERRKEQEEQIADLSHNNLLCASIVKNLEEEVDLDQEKIEKIRENLDCLLASNVSEHYEAASYGKQRSLIQMKTLKMQEVIGLLDKPHLLNKMAASLREIQCLKDKSEIIELQIYSDAIRHALLL